MSEAGDKLKAAMELESALLEKTLQEAQSESDAEGVLEFAKSLILVDRCAFMLMAMTIRGVAEQIDEAKSLAQQLFWRGFDLDALKGS